MKIHVERNWGEVVVVVTTADGRERRAGLAEIVLYSSFALALVIIVAGLAGLAIFLASTMPPMMKLGTLGLLAASAAVGTWLAFREYGG